MKPITTVAICTYCTALCILHGHVKHETVILIALGSCAYYWLHVVEVLMLFTKSSKTGGPVSFT